MNILRLFDTSCSRGLTTVFFTIPSGLGVSSPFCVFRRCSVVALRFFRIALRAAVFELFQCCSPTHNAHPTPLRCHLTTDALLLPFYPSSSLINRATMVFRRKREAHTPYWMHSDSFSWFFFEFSKLNRYI